MPRLQLVGGSYSPRSIIANCQRCINLYPEKNAVGSPVPLTYYQRPGLRPLLTPQQVPQNAPVRCLYRASNGVGYAVIGDGVYKLTPYIDPDNGIQGLDIEASALITAGRTTPVSLVDNGVEIMIVDGSPSAWKIDMGTNVSTDISSPVFPGADKVDYIDGFIIYNIGDTNKFGSTLFGTPITFDPLELSFGIKSGYPDPIQSLIVNRREITVVGTLKSEVWYNAGLAGFAFAPLPGAYYEHGTVAKYSLAAMDVSVYWLGLDLQGQGIVWRARGYQCTRISNFALEYQIRKMAKTPGVLLDDAIGYCYQQDGHQFYVLHFRSGDQTWVFDETLGADPEVAWHQEAWTDADGVHHRHRANCHAFMYGMNVVGDWENGMLYEMDLNLYIDVVGNIPQGVPPVAYPISRIRGFPHITTGDFEMGPFGRRPVLADGHRVQFHQFIADIESGLATATPSGTGTPMVTLRYSDDRGRTWSSDVLQTGGAQGEYLTWPTWRGLGIARDRVFELEYSHNGEAALNGAWVEGTVLES